MFQMEPEPAQHVVDGMVASFDQRAATAASSFRSHLSPAEADRPESILSGSKHSKRSSLRSGTASGSKKSKSSRGSSKSSKNNRPGTSSDMFPEGEDSIIGKGPGSYAGSQGSGGSVWDDNKPYEVNIMVRFREVPQPNAQSEGLMSVIAKTKGKKGKKGGKDEEEAVREGHYDELTGDWVPAVNVNQMPMSPRQLALMSAGVGGGLGGVGGGDDVELTGKFSHFSGLSSLGKYSGGRGGSDGAGRRVETAVRISSERRKVCKLFCCAGFCAPQISTPSLSSPSSQQTSTSITVVVPPFFLLLHIVHIFYSSHLPTIN